MPSIHASRYKLIKTFVNFSFSAKALKNLSDYDKRKIKKYYNTLEPFLQDANKVYRPRKKDNLKKALQFANINTDLKGIKAVPIKTNITNAKIRSTKNGLVIKGSALSERFIRFDIEGYKKFLANSDGGEDAPQKYADKILSKIPNIKDAAYSTDNTSSVLNAKRGKEIYAEHLTALFNNYSVVSENNFIGHWLEGVHIITGTRQDVDKYRKARRATKKTLTTDEKITKLKKELLRLQKSKKSQK